MRCHYFALCFTLVKVTVEGMILSSDGSCLVDDLNVVAEEDVTSG